MDEWTEHGNNIFPDKYYCFHYAVDGKVKSCCIFIDDTEDTLLSNRKGYFDRCIQIKRGKLLYYPFTSIPPNRKDNKRLIQTQQMMDLTYAMYK